MAQSGVKLIQDEYANAVQVLTPDHSTIVNAATSGTSAVSALPSGANIVEIAVTEDTWILFTTSGGSVASTTGEFMPKGAKVVGVPSDATHIAYLQDTTAGRITVVKQE